MSLPPPAIKRFVPPATGLLALTARLVPLAPGPLALATGLVQARSGMGRR